MPREDVMFTGRGWSHRAASLGIQSLLWPPRRSQREAKVPLQLSEGAWPCWHLDSGLQASRIVRPSISVVLNRSVCCKAAPGDQYTFWKCWGWTGTLSSWGKEPDELSCTAFSERVNSHLCLPEVPVWCVTAVRPQSICLTGSPRSTGRAKSNTLSQ